MLDTTHQDNRDYVTAYTIAAPIVELSTASDASARLINGTKFFSKLHSKHQGLEMTNVSGVSSVEFQIVDETRSATCDAHCMIDVLPLQPLHSLIINFVV